MEELLAERIKRLHGDFLDPTGEYEIVSSLSTKSKALHQQENINEKAAIDPLHDSSNDSGDDVEIIRGLPIPLLDDGKVTTQIDAMFYIRAFWIMFTLGVVVWFSRRWIVASSTKNLTISRLKEKAKAVIMKTEHMTTTMTMTKTTTTTNVTCTRTSQKSRRCPKNVVQNLSLQFEQVKDVPKSDSDPAEAELSDQTSAEGHREVLMVSSTTNCNRQEFFQQSCTSSSPQPDSGRRNLSSQTNSETFSPELIEEEVESSSPSTLMPLVNAPTCPNTPPPNKAQVVVLERVSSSTSLPAPSPNHASQKPPRYSTSAPIGFASSESNNLSTRGKFSSLVQTPEKLAWEFCQNIKIIEQVCAESGTELDPSRAAELAMMHQTSQIKQRQQIYEEQERFEYRSRKWQSTSLEKTDQYLRQLSKFRDECFQSISSAFHYSILVCLLLEGGRHAANLLESMEYFSAKQLAGVVLQMACGCNDDEGPLFDLQDDGHSNIPDSYISMMSSFFLVTMSQSIANTANQSLMSLLRFAEYISCALCYILIIGVLIVSHAILRELHCPSLIHQLLNIMVLICYLAQNPGAWVVVLRNLEVYKGWLLVQITISVLSFCLVMALYIKMRNQMLQEQQQRTWHQSDNNVHKMKQEQFKSAYAYSHRMLAQLEDLCWIVGIVPPLLMGAVVLTTAEHRS
jgi:hypothetical protein